MPRQDHWNKVGEGEVDRVRELCDMVSVNIIINQGPNSFSFFELKTFLKTFFTTLTTYCKKFAIFLRKLKIH